MACFEDLPQELVDYIVELATPSFQLKRWDERARTLNALCLTSKAFFRPARRLLHREILVDKSSSLSALLSTRYGAVGTTGPARTSLLVIDNLFRPDGWPSDEKDANIAQMAVLLDRLQPPKVAFRGAPIPLLSVVRGVTSLILDGCMHLERPPVPYQCFQALTRLGIYCTEFRLDQPIFTSAAFPNLVTLALGNTMYLPLGADNENDNFELLSCREGHFPLLPQLRAASVQWTDGLVDSSPLAVLDTYLFGDATTLPRDFAPSLKVLRLARPSLSPSDMTLPSVLPLLSSPSFRPHLLELHLIGFPLHNAATSKVWSEIEAWCGANGVRLFKSNPDDLDDPLDLSFWRFLDGVKGRLGLNV
ncbi:hypothetical protein JCM6882_000375 [Rhodosporidiobolus microsporus]